jgi:hypothetical protein
LPARSGIEFLRGTASDSALETLLERGMVEHPAPPADHDAGFTNSPGWATWTTCQRSGS